MSVKWTQPVMNGDNSSPAVDASGVDVSNGCGQTDLLIHLRRLNQACPLIWHGTTSPADTRAAGCTHSALTDGR